MKKRKYLNREEFIATLQNACKWLCIDPKDVVISHGGAALLQGITMSTQDIDANINFKVWDKTLHGCYEEVYRTKNIVALNKYCKDVTIIQAYDVDFHVVSDDEYSLEELVSLDNGFKVTNRKRLLEDRLRLGRSKDIHQIKYLWTMYGESLDITLKKRYYELMNQYKEYA